MEREAEEAMEREWEARSLSVEANISMGRAVHLLATCEQSYQVALQEAGNSHLPAIVAISPTMKQLKALRSYCQPYKIRVEAFLMTEIKPHYVKFQERVKEAETSGQPLPLPEMTVFPELAELLIFGGEHLPGGVLYCVTFTDLFVAFADWLNENLGLDGWNQVASAHVRLNKFDMQEGLKCKGITSARSAVARSFEEARNIIAQGGFTFPVVLKPVEGAGSEGLSLCHTLDEIEVAFRVTIGKSGQMLAPITAFCVQEYLVGDEYVVDAVSCRGSHVITDVWHSYKYPAQFTEVDGIARFNIMYDRQELVLDCSDGDPFRVCKYTVECLDALEFVSGASHCEIILQRETNLPVLVEVNPRMQGDLPRSGPIIGFDQLTLLAYLGAIRNDLGAWPPAGIRQYYSIPRVLTEVQQSMTVAQLAEFRPEAAIPTSANFPGACPLYCAQRVLDSQEPRPLNPQYDLRTRHVIFMLVKEDSVLMEQAKRYVRKFLPTFISFTRTSIDRDPPKGRVFRVDKTVDLFSSPAAIILEGTTQDIQRDITVIRAMEQSHFVIGGGAAYGRWGADIVQVYEGPILDPLPPPFYVSQRMLSHLSAQRASNFIFSWVCPWEGDIDPLRVPEEE